MTGSVSTTLEHHDEDVDRQLWCAVLSQAIEDATSTRISKRAQSEKQAALDWLLVDSIDFKTVCTLAGVEPDAVRDRLMQMPGVVEKFREIAPDQTSPEPLSRSKMGFFQQ
ncbi:MAG TPA: hypothetical protein VHC94_19170 [Nitrobacter sp.]|nr:hypothetical protein [Nitrobacter sp.]